MSLILGAQYSPATPGLRLGGRGVLLGWSIRDNSGGTDPVNFDILDGTDSNGQTLACAVAPSKGSDTRWLGPQGIVFERGLFLVAGTPGFTGAIYYVPETLYPPSILTQMSGSQRKVTPYVGQDDLNELMGLE